MQRIEVRIELDEGKEDAGNVKEEIISYLEGVSVRKGLMLQGTFSSGLELSGANIKESVYLKIAKTIRGLDGIRNSSVTAQ